MKILALDLSSKRVGWCLGDSLAERIRLSAWMVRREGQSFFTGTGNLGCYLRDLLSLEKPDLIAVEDYTKPEGQPSGEAAEAAILARGALQALAFCYGITPVRAVAVAEARKAFCGKSTAHPPPKRGEYRSARTKKQYTYDTKKMIWDHGVALGLIPEDLPQDFDKSDALAVWSWAACKFGDRPPPFLLK